jgi:hypothetical protein
MFMKACKKAANAGVLVLERVHIWAMEYRKLSENYQETRYNGGRERPTFVRDQIFISTYSDHICLTYQEYKRRRAFHVSVYITVNLLPSRTP